MRAYDPTEQRFLKDVDQHEMTVVLDDKEHRHLRFRRPGTYCMGFDVITWPGYLCICGDMGDYLFSRLSDMFEFFRGNPDGPLEINPSYWGEKTRNNKTKEYSAERFREAVNSYLADDNEDITPELREAVRDQVLAFADDEWLALPAAHDFSFGDFQFDSFYEHDCREWTYHYLWCCYAVAWAIRQYDKTK